MFVSFNKHGANYLHVKIQLQLKFHIGVVNYAKLRWKYSLVHSEF